MAAGDPSPPSGEQHEIALGDQRAVVVEVGGGLRAYRCRGFEVLDGFAPDELCTGARGQPLIPWPNRVADGRYRFRGQELQLPLTEPERQTAIHGLLRWRDWQAVEKGPAHVVMESLLHPQPGYPFTLLARIRYALGEDGLAVTLAGRNLGPEPLPLGLGQHPYVRVAEGLIDEAVVRSPARTRLDADARGIPTGERMPVSGDFDLRRPRRLGALRLDTAFTDLERDGDGLARVVLRGGEREVTVWMDAAFGHLMLFTGDTLEPARRRRGLGVEPMTCPPNAFPTGADVIVLDPGQEASASWGISVTELT